MYRLLDYFFILFHTAFMIFNLFGWAIKKLRKFNLITLLLTAFSWFVLGFWKGWGYCPLTDWHFDILRKLEKTNLPNSYVKYLIERMTGIAVNAQLIDICTLFFFAQALVISVYLNTKDFKRIHSSKL